MEKILRQASKPNLFFDSRFLILNHRKYRLYLRLYIFRILQYFSSDDPKKLPMKNASQTRLKIFTLVSFACMSIPVSIYVLWLYVIDLGSTQAERVTIFNSYFPEFLHERWDTTLVSIVFCISSIILSNISLSLSQKIWRILNYIILVISSLLLALNVFSMM